MTVCNMTIEGGGRAGMIAPDETTFDYVIGRPGAPAAVPDDWRELSTEDGAHFDREITIDCAQISPMVTWGTNPGMVVGVADRACPSRPASRTSARSSTWASRAARRSSRSSSTGCSSARAPTPGSATCGPPPRWSPAARWPTASTRWSYRARCRSRSRPRREGLDEVFRAAGFDWRAAGCSMCLGMNPDIAAPGERVASTSNRNFEGRQGRGARTHLVSPQMAAAAAIEGHFVDIRNWAAANPRPRRGANR